MVRETATTNLARYIPLRKKSAMTSITTASRVLTKSATKMETTTALLALLYPIQRQPPAPLEAETVMTGISILTLELQTFLRSRSLTPIAMG